MEAQTALYQQICRILTIDYHDSTNDKNRKIFRSAGVLHRTYLIDASRETRQIINKSIVTNKYGLMMSIYNRKIKEHQVLMLLVHLFEVAMRANAAIVLSRKFSWPYEDDWYWLTTSGDRQTLQDQIDNLALTKHFSITSNTTTFDMFNLLSIGDLKKLYKKYWRDFAPFFNKTSFKSNTIPPFNNRTEFLACFERIRKYRNELYHNNPGSVGWSQITKDIEDILVQLHYNVKDAINNIDPHHRIIHLQYTY